MTFSGSCVTFGILLLNPVTHSVSTPNLLEGDVAIFLLTDCMIKEFFERSPVDR